MQSALYDAAKITPGISIRTGWQLSEVQQDFGKVLVRFRSNDDEQEIEGAILLGADGVWSPTREFVVWSAKPKHSGYDAWRATCQIGNLPPLLANFVQAGASVHSCRPMRIWWPILSGMRS